jgi:hypothetical protein
MGSSAERHHEEVAMATVLDRNLAPLIGSWRLISTIATFVDTGERVETFGPDPEGRMVFTADGRIMFLIMKSNRRSPTNDEERAALFKEMISYTGKVRLDGPDRFITTVDVSLIPSEVGIEKQRHFAIDGDRLTIRLPENQNRFAQGRMTISELAWEREHPE